MNGQRDLVVASLLAVGHPDQKKTNGKGKL